MNNRLTRREGGTRRKWTRATVAIGLSAFLVMATSVTAFADRNSPKYGSYYVCKGWQVYYKTFLKKTITIPCWKPAPDKWWFNYK